MTLKEAVESGKKIKRAGWECYYPAHALNLEVKDAFAEDWVVEDERIVMWANVYQKNRIFCYASRAEADAHASRDRLKCVKLIESKDEGDK